MADHFLSPTRRASPSSKKTPIQVPAEWVPLQNHPLFSSNTNTNTTTTPSSSSCYGNLAAWDPSSSRLYAWEPNSLRLHRLLLRFPDSDSDSSAIEAASTSEILTPDTPIRYPIRHIALNRDGSSLLLLPISEDALTVIYLRERTFRTGIVGSEVFSGAGHSKGLQVLQASWHPFSENHLGVLSSDSVFRLYDLSCNLERPEQEFYLQVPGSSNSAVSICPLSFSFGGQHLWDRFSIFLLFSDGSIYIICPVVPFGSFCSSAFLVEIYEDVNTFGLKSANTKVVNNSALAINWLESTFPELPDQSMEGGDKVVLRAHPYAPLDASLSLQGPLCKIRNIEENVDSSGWSADCEGKAVSFLYNSIGKDSILVIAWSSGQLQIDALADEIQPFWNMGSPPRLRFDPYGHMKGVAMICESNLEELSLAKLTHLARNANNTADTVWLGHPPPLLRLGIVDLALPSSALDNCTLALFPDLLEAQKFYCLHGGGIDLINLHFLPFSDMMHETENIEKTPSVYPILSTCHSESCSMSLLPGFVTIADPYGHVQVVGITPSYECLVLEVRGQDEVNPFHYDMNAKSVCPTENAGIPDFETISKDLLTGPKTNIVSLSSTLRTLTGDSIEGRSTLHHYMKMFRENHVEYAHKVYIELKHHTNYQKMVLDDQQKRLHDTKQMLLNVEGKESGIKDRIDRAFKVYELLEQRLQNFKMLPAANRKPLSRAEREFKSQLERFADLECDAVHSSIEALNARLRRCFQSSPTSTSNITRQAIGRRKALVSDGQMLQVRSSLETLSKINNENTKKVKLIEHELKGLQEQ